MNTKRVIVVRGVDELGQPEEFTWDLYPLLGSEEVAHLDENGLPIVGTHILEGMVLVGKWGKSAQYDEHRLPDPRELNGLSRDELLTRYGHYWRNTSSYADKNLTGVVTSAWIEGESGSQRAVVELSQTSEGFTPHE